MRFELRFRSIRLRILFFLASLLCAGSANPESYGWPLDENYGISATFGEYREDHFHAGLDLSTNGETGLPVRAIAEGKVYRMKIQKRGYGRALYIQHPDGMTSVYAHLESFSLELGLEQIYQQKVVEAGTRYVGDIFLEPPVPVKKGEIIAYSGETGAGLPHLHLEIRRNDTIAVNPLSNGFQDALDPVPPTLQACYLYPLTPDSAVDGDLETVEIRLKKEETYFVPDHTPIVRGDFMVAVSAYDAALRPYHRGPKKILLSIDNHPVYSLEFNELSYLQPEGFGLTYDLGKPGPSYYEYPILLRRIGETTPPFLSYSAPLSTKNLSPGLHELQIEVSDANNNTSLAHIDFIVNHPPTIRIENISADEKDLIVEAGISDPNWKATGVQSLAGDVEYSIDEGKTYLPFPITELDLSSIKDSVRFKYRVSLDQLPGKRIILKARGFDGMEYSPYSVVAVSLGIPPRIEVPQKAPQGVARIVTYPNAIKVLFDTSELLTYPLQVQVGTPPTTFLMESRDLTSYSAVIPAPRQNEPVQLTFPGNQTFSLPIHYFQKGMTGQIQGENFDIVFDEDTLYWDTFIWTKPLPSYRARYLPPVGSLLQLGPRGVPTKKSARLLFHYPLNWEHPEKLSVYSWDRSRQAWKSLPSTVDQTNRTVQASIGVFDLYALLYDNVAPVVSPIFPKRWSSTSNRTPKLAVRVTDKGMDVDDERITFHIDKTAYLAEYDPDRNLATATIERPLSKGYHKFWVTAYDYAGNKTTSPRITFRIR